MDYHQYFHQNTKLVATPSVKTCVSKILKESPGRRQEHRAADNWMRLEHQARGGLVATEDPSSEKKVHLHPSKEKSISGGSSILQRISSRRARRSTTFLQPSIEQFFVQRVVNIPPIFKIFPLNVATWRQFTGDCFWASSWLAKDHADFHRTAMNKSLHRTQDLIQSERRQVNTLIECKDAYNMQMLQDWSPFRCSRITMLSDPAAKIDQDGSSRVLRFYIVCWSLASNNWALKILRMCGTDTDVKKKKEVWQPEKFSPRGTCYQVLPPSASRRIFGDAWTAKFQNFWWEDHSHVYVQVSHFSLSLPSLHLCFQRQSHDRLDSWGKKKEITTTNVHSTTRRCSHISCWQAIYFVFASGMRLKIWYSHQEERNTKNKLISTPSIWHWSLQKKPDTARSSRRLDDTTLQLTGKNETSIDSESFKKQVATAEGKAQSDKRLLTGSQNAWILHDFFKINGYSEAILDSSDLSKVAWESGTAHWQIDWPHVGESAQDASWKLGRIEVHVASFRSGDDIWRQKPWFIAYGSWWLQDISSRKLRIPISERETEMRTDYRKEKANKMPNTIPKEETASIASRKGNDHLEKHAHSSMTRTRKAKERDGLAHFLPQAHHAETRKVTEKVAMTKVLKAHTHTTLLITVSQESERTALHKLQEKKLPKGIVIIGMFPNVQKSKLQVDADWETCVHTNTQQNLLMNRETQYRLLFTFHRVLKDRKIQSDNNTQYRVRLDLLANKYVFKRQKLGPTHGAIQTRLPNQRNPNAQTFEKRSIECDEIVRKTAWILHNSVYWIPGSYSENRHKFFKPSSASNVSSLCITTSEERERNAMWTRELHFMWWVIMIWLQKSRKRFKSRRIHQLVWVHMELLIQLKKKQFCLWFGHVCSCSTIGSIAHDAFAGWIAGWKRLLAWMASRSAIKYHRGWEKHRMQNRQSHSLGGPRGASNRTPDRSSGRLEAETSCGRPRATCGHRYTRTALTVHGRIDEDIFKCDRRIPNILGHTLSSSSFRTSSSKTFFKQNADARQLRGRHAKEIQTIGRTESK